jgi:hypothetical protein
MDLHRVITASGDLTKKLPTKSIIAFLEHADKDFTKALLDSREKSIRKDLKILAGELETLSDPHKRLRWTEDVMTARCRL